MQPPSTAVPPKIGSPSGPARLAAVAGGVAIVGGAVLLYRFNPSTHHFYPVCLFHSLTGLNCPGCGGTRAVYALLHGHLAAAIRDNALAVLSLPVILGWFAWAAWQKKSGQAVVFNPSPFWLWTFLAVVIAFSILRNLPAFWWLSP